MNKCCKVEKRIIFKGSSVTVTIRGYGITEGTSYTGCLYYDARNTLNRALAQGVALNIGDVTTLVLYFSAEETAKLKVGNATFEFYDDATKDTFGHIGDFAEVRPSSLGY